MKTVTFRYVRHGRTEFNRDDVIQGGGCDSPLDPAGIPALETTARALAACPFAACWASPLPRAQETARIVLGGRSLPIRPLDDLLEVRFGSIDGLPYEGRRRAFLRCFVRQDFSPLGGDAGRDVRRRVRRAFARMYLAAADGDEVLVVGHGAYLRYVLLEFSGTPWPWRRAESELLRTPNGSVATVVGRDGGFRLVQGPVAPDELPGGLLGFP